MNTQRTFPLPTPGGLLAVALLVSSLASADCIKDIRGEVYCGAGQCLTDSRGKVWCSRHYEGGAVKTLDGQVLCGRGLCATDISGQVVCSAEIGGSVLKDGRGRVRCYGQCEPASVEHCESTPGAE